MEKGFALIATERGRFTILGLALACGLNSACGAPAGGSEATDGTDQTDPVSSTPSTFVHPGALNNGAQLAFIKEKIAAGAEPWSAALAKAEASSRASLSYVPHPPTDSHGAVECGPGSNPDIHCLDERNDAAAAYTDALIWALRGDPAHARKAVEILDSWSAVTKTHSLSNAAVQTGWSGSVFARAAEIIRYTFNGWPKADVDRFAQMLRTAYVPTIAHGAPHENGNWELSCADALIQIAVFLDDRSLFATAVALWKRRVPAYLYLKSDGPTPVTFAGEHATWNGARTFFDGLTQETCRDLGHTQFGLAALINTAETALIQGVDLYSLQAKRISTALEVNAGFVDTRARSCAACSLMEGTEPTWEIAYNEYSGRLGMSLPNVQKLVKRLRPTGTDEFFIDWETLTHADLGRVGIR